MKLKDKRILVLGLGISGVSTAKTLDNLGASVVVSDSKDIDELSRYTEELKGLKIGFCLGSQNKLSEEFDLIVKSPGIPTDIPMLKKAVEKGIEIVTDIELLDRLYSNRIIAITGTNGKTTTTYLIASMIKKCGVESHIMGNIGVGVLWAAHKIKNKDDIFVVESSSFQLESTHFFKPEISVILNFSPDHLAWHDGYENYKNAKIKIMENQTKAETVVLNYDDLDVRNLGLETEAKVIYFSRLKLLDNGICLENEDIVCRKNKLSTKIISIDDLNIVGNHNVENVMASIATAIALNLELKLVREGIKEFKAVEHRLEFVKTIKNVDYYNDSKGTNVDSSIKAIEAIKEPIILIAGGYDKGSEFDEYIKAFKGKVKHMLVMGKTAEKIIKTAVKYDFEKFTKVENMKEAIQLAEKLSESGDTVLLSPACASWGMYDNYEQRGADFKSLVESIN